MSQQAGPGTPPDLPFALDEYQARLAGVRAGMGAQGLDALLLHAPENIFYLSGHQTLGYIAYQCLVVPLRGAPALVTRALMGPVVRAGSWVREWRGYEDDQEPVAATAAAVREAGLARGRLGIERNGWFCTAAQQERLRALLPEARFAEGGGIVESRRLVKSKAELARIRQAARLAAAALQAGLEAAKVGVTEDRVAAAIMAASIEAGSEYLGHPPLIASGPRTALPFATWSGRVLQAGEPLFLEVGGCVGRYHAAVMRTAHLGPAPVRLRQMLAASRAGVTAALAAMRPGTPSGEVDRACREAVAAAGFGHCFHHRSGYSIGIGFPPDWGEGRLLSLRPMDPTPLQAGMVFHVVPFLSVEGEVGCAVSETVLVTETGAERLTDVPQELFIR